MTRCRSFSPTARSTIAYGPDPGRGGLPSQDPLPENGSNDNATVTDPSSFACGHLLEKYDGGTTTFNLRGLDGALLREVELKAGAYEWVKDYIYRDGQLLASQHRTEGHQHYHLDHLGTTRMLTNRCGERVKRYELFPYGDTISPPTNDTETRRFTGHQRDLGSPTNTTDDLDYMHARYYGVKMGRLLSVDPGGSRTTRPMSWNRYAYTVGNPVILVDPDGRAWQPPKWLNDIASIAAGFLPGLGEFQDGTVALTGYDPITSEPVKWSERGICGVSLFVPFVGGRAVAKSGSELHHIATHINKRFGPQFAELFEQAGLSVKKSVENIVELVGHSGRHTNAYHKWVLDQLRDATKGLSGSEFAKALLKQLEVIKRILKKDPRLPYVMDAAELEARAMKAT